MDIARRTALAGGAATGLAVATWSGSRAATPSPPYIVTRAQTHWDPPPAPAPAKTGLARLADVELYYWDTGGAGQPVVLLHPATGSAAVWGYQQAPLVAAGYRVIAYSRRGYRGSQAGPPDRTGTAVGDLDALADVLGLKRFHLVGSAAGGFIVPDYAVSHPDRLFSAVIASSLGGATDPDFRQASAALTPKGFAEMPASFREVGPSYRAAYPDGVRAWEALERTAMTQKIRQKPVNDLSWTTLAAIEAPMLMLTGDADLFMPPSRAAQYAAHVPGCELAVIAEAGHSAYWEQPIAFNRLVLDFIGRHGHTARAHSSKRS